MVFQECIGQSQLQQLRKRNLRHNIILGTVFQKLVVWRQNDTLNCTLDEIALLKFLKDNPEATQTEIAAHIGKSLRTVKRITPSLIERGLLDRENGKRNGKWVVKNINLNR